MFNFHIKVSGRVASACRNTARTLIYGDAYYHPNLKIVICLLNSPLAGNAIPSAATMTVSGFYTRHYNSDRNVDAIVSVRSKQLS